MPSQSPLIRHARAHREIRILMMISDQASDSLFGTPARPRAHVRHYWANLREPPSQLCTRKQRHLEKKLGSKRQRAEESHVKLDADEVRGAVRNGSCCSIVAQLLQ